MTTATWIGTSWKMNKLLAEAKAFASRLRECPPPPAVLRFVIPAFLAIHTVAVALGPDSDEIVGAQNAPDMLDKVLPYANYWHVKNYLRDEDPTTGQVMTFPVPMEFGLINYRAAISQALDVGFRGAFLCEHYGSDAITVIGKNRALRPRHPRHRDRLTEASKSKEPQ
jgi:Triosephosphate isomerase